MKKSKEQLIESLSKKGVLKDADKSELEKSLSRISEETLEETKLRFEDNFREYYTLLTS